MNTLLKDQNNDSFLRLLKAQRTAYKEAKRYQFIDVISILIALSPTILFFIEDPVDSVEFVSKTARVTSIITVIGVIWTIVSIICQSLVDRQTKIGAIIQDQFDTELFQLDKNEILIENWIETSEIVILSKGSKVDNLKNWYSINIPSNIDNNASILLAYKCNTIFAKAQRKKYVNFLYIIVVIYYLCLFGFSLNNDVVVFDMILLFAPSISALVFITQTIKAQNGILETYDKINILVERLYAEYRSKQTIPSKEQLRQIQDLFYIQRLISNKIPTWFYQLFKESTEEIMNESIKIMVSE